MSPVRSRYPPLLEGPAEMICGAFVLRAGQLEPDLGYQDRSSNWGHRAARASQTGYRSSRRATSFPERRGREPQWARRAGTTARRRLRPVLGRRVRAGFPGLISRGPAGRAAREGPVGWVRARRRQGSASSRVPPAGDEDGSEKTDVGLRRCPRTVRAIGAFVYRRWAGLRKLRPPTKTSVRCESRVIKGSVVLSFSPG